MDGRLLPFLHAPTEELADKALALLIAEAEGLVSRTILRRERSARRADAEDALSEARANLVARLRRLRAEAGRSPIGDFNAYTKAVAYTSWALVTRRRNPQRAALVNRLQYLLENRTNQRGFALWDTADGEHWAGFEVWRGKKPDAETLERQGRLAADPHAVAAEIFGMPSSALTSTHLAEILAALLSWLGGPTPLRDLTNAIAEWQGIFRPQETHLTGQPGENSLLANVADPGPSPHDELRWREYLAWLWQETARLTLRQRTAFLLHSACLRELEVAGLTSVRQAAERLEVPPERMAEYWNDLPLEDRLIAALLGVQNQQVINLRRVARDILGRAWHAWIQEK